MAEALLGARAIDVNRRAAKRGWTPIMYAARYGHTEIVRMLLDKGADANLSAESTTALALAQRYGHASTADLLKGRGAR